MKNNLEFLRKQIDGIDESIVTLLAKRMEVVKKVGQYKKENNIQVFDKKRLEKILDSKKGFMKKIWKIIHDESLEIEEKI